MKAWVLVGLLLGGQERRMLRGALSGDVFPGRGVASVFGMGSCGLPPLVLITLRVCFR